MAYGKATLECFTCDVINKYVSLANDFTQDLSSDLVVPMWAIFGGLAAVWIVVQGIKLILGSLDMREFAREFVYMVIAAGLMTGQGPKLVDMVYVASLSTMSGAASAILSTGSIGKATQVPVATAPVGTASGIDGLDGMTALVATAEKGVLKVFQITVEIAAQASLTAPMPIIYALLLLAPYALLLIVYFAQVTVTIFRVMMLAALSPILMLMFGFNFGRGMAFTGVRTLFASFMVLYGATIALAVCLYGVAELNVADPNMGANVSDILSLDNPKLWVAIILGWMGTAFLAEATGMANSIAGSQLTNQAAAIITAGATATGLSLMKKMPTPTQALDAGRTLAGVAANPKGAASTAYQAVKDRLSIPQFDNK